MSILFIIGTALLLGLFSSYIVKKLNIPQVVGHLFVGIILGISGINLFSASIIQDLQFISHIALGIIGFMIGGELRWARLRHYGISILTITLSEALITFVAVFCIIFIISKNIPLSLILGALSSATAPGGTTNVIQEYRARGPLTTTLLGVVGADDAISIIIFAISFNISKDLLTSGTHLDITALAISSAHEILGSILIGSLMAIPFFFMIKILRDDDAKQLFTLASLLICTGICIDYQFSLILSTMAMGITFSNFHPHKSRPYFTNLYKLSPPIYILFFILVGSSLNISLLPAMGIIGTSYVIFRSIGKISGAWLGGYLSGASRNVRRYLGWCLLSQAGVAIGLAIAVQTEFQALTEKGIIQPMLIHNQDIGSFIINMITASTLIFQVIGPIMAKAGLKNAKEIK